MRKIIGWWHHPERSKLRSAGRAAAAWMERPRGPWQFSSVKPSCAELSWSRACESAGGGYGRFTVGSVERNAASPSCTPRARRSSTKNCAGRTWSSTLWVRESPWLRVTFLPCPIPTNCQRFLTSRQEHAICNKTFRSCDPTQEPVQDIARSE